MTDRLSLRAWLAGLLVVSAALFFIGISLERGVSTPAGPIAVQTSPSAHVEGAAGEAGAASQPEAPAASTGEVGESTAKHAAETWPLGIDLEAPLLVGGAIVISLLLAVAVLRTMNPLIPVAIIGFSLLVAVLDLLELSHQLGASRSGLAASAGVLLLLHVVAALIALRLLVNQRSALAAAR